MITLLADSAMDFAAVLVMAASFAFVVLGPIVWMLFRRLRTLRGRYDKMWIGITERGLSEAKNKGHIIQHGGRWILSADAIVACQPIKFQLRQMYRDVVQKLGRTPTDEEYAFAVKQHDELREWIHHNVCPALDMNQHGCLAVVCLIAQESVNGDVYHS